MSKPDKKTASFMRSLCMGKIEEDLIVPFPVMKKEEGESLRTIFDSLNGWLKNKDKDFREWDFKGEMPLRAALDRIAAACDVEIAGLWTGRVEPGLDPDRMVRLSLRPGASCMEAMECLLHEVDDGAEPVLWQTTRFGVEVGPRAALWRPKAIETRTYEVKDLLLRVPAFRSTGVPQPGGVGGGQGGGAGGGQGGGAGGNVEDPAAGERRQLRTDELIELIQRTVEPEAWSGMGGPCSIAARDGVLIIRAPDFVHRRIQDPVSAAPRTRPAPGHGKGN